MANLPDTPSTLASIFRRQGRWYLEQGQYEKALESFEVAKKQPGQDQNKFFLNATGLFEAAIMPPNESLELAKQVLETAREGGLNGLALGALTRCAQACLKLNKSKQALEYSNEAIKMLTTYDLTNFYLGEIHLTHYQSLKACKDKTAKDYLRQTLAWLMDVADKHVPSEYRESFLNNNPVNKAILEAARLEGLLSKTSV